MPTRRLIRKSWSGKTELLYERPLPDRYLLEAGRRNSEKDKDSIRAIITRAVGQLDTEDAAQAIADAMAEHDISIDDVEACMSDGEGEED